MESTHKEQALRIFNKLKLKILVVNPVYGGSLPTAGFTASALKNLGHDVEIFEADRFYDGFKNIGMLTPDKNDTALLQASYTNLLGEGIIARAKHINPDLLIAIAQAPIGSNVLKRLRAMNIPTAFWFVEDFNTLTYWKSVAPFYDYFFTLQKDKFFEELKNIGVKNYYCLPQACCPSTHRKTTITEIEQKEYGSDISFMGAGYYNRQRFFKGLIDFDFKIWGTDWDILSPLWKVVQRQGRIVSTDNCIKIYNSAKINVNLHSSSYHEGVNPHGDFLNPRTFEIASCGGFQIVDHRAYLPECFEIDKEIVTYSNIDELREKITYFLEHPEERAKIAQNGQERVLKNHTFENRMREMLLYIIENDIDRFGSMANKENEVDKLIDEAGKSTELGKYLSGFQGRTNLALSDIIHDIENGDGNLSKPESIFLMMNQLLIEKK